jgi:Flp pilus assembly protein TadG
MVIATLGRFLRCRKGSPAVEFALIAPVMILMYMGSSEICQAVVAKRKLTQVADTVSDLVGRSDTLSAADVTAIREVADDIMFPTPWAQSDNICVRYYKKNASNAIVQDWANGCSGNGTTPPANMFPAATSSLVVVTATYAYTSPTTNLFIPNGMSLSTTAYYTPRDSEYVVYTN